MIQQRSDESRVLPARSIPTAAADAWGQRRAEAEAREPGRFLEMLVPALVLWFESLLVLSSGDTSRSAAAPVAAIAGTVGLFLHLPILAQVRWFRGLLGLLGVLFLLRLAVYPPAALESGFVVLPRAVTITVAEFLLCCQVVLFWRCRRGDPLPTAFPCLALLTAVLALNRPLPMVAQTNFVFLVTVALLLPALMIPVLPSRERGGPSTLPWPARLVLLLVCGGVLVGTWGIARVWSNWLPVAQTWFASQVGRSLDLYERMPHYITTSSLGAIRSIQTYRPDATALQVYSAEQPGYLAGRVFDRYEAGQWVVVSDLVRQEARGQLDELRILRPLAAVPEAVGEPEGRLATFELNGAGSFSSLRRLTIENDRRRGRVFFTPLGCRYVQGAGELLALDDHDIIRFGISVEKPYVALVGASSPTQALAETQRQRLLATTPGLDPRAAQLAQWVCRGARTPQDKMRAVRDYFQDNYSYSLDPVKHPEATDPLSHFLLNTRTAHCEFFASGAVMMLRMQGIPARYATGYRVMDRKEGEDSCWLAKNRDAHAWAEAYDVQQQRWFLVEATPGFIDVTQEDPLGTQSPLAGAQVAGLALVTESANALVWWWRGLPGWVRGCLLAMLFGAVPAVVWFLARRFRFSGSVPGREPLDPARRHGQRLLRRMDRRLKRHGWVRHPSETLHQFAHRLGAQAEGRNLWLRSSADWYVAYAHTRFGTALLEPPPLPRKDTPRPLADQAGPPRERG